MVVNRKNRSKNCFISALPVWLGVVLAVNGWFVPLTNAFGPVRSQPMRTTTTKTLSLISGSATTRTELWSRGGVHTGTLFWGSRDHRIATKWVSRRHPPKQQFHWGVHLSSSNNDDEEVFDDEEQELIVRGSDNDNLSDDKWDEIQAGAPPESMVMKELLGVNAFTYILGALIAIFLGANAILGPGWLGQSIGLEGTGTFTQVSPSLPDTLDLSSPEYLL
mmetsp:Transcript_24993/g.45262  ORF Transcript_24993/g.45262 Transcript_24993/m.45262 type:complete len:220 (-) Transcript_24993:1896-2555(-)